MTTSPDPAAGLQAVLDDIRACRACLGQLPHTPRPVVHLVRNPWFEDEVLPCLRERVRGILTA